MNAGSFARCSTPVTLGSMPRFLALAVCSVILAASIASAAPGPGGPGANGRAEMYAHVLDEGRTPIQILTELCAKPRPRTQCRPMPQPLRHAISVAVDRQISWVHEHQPGMGVLWVLSPVRSEGERARFRYAWSKPDPSACSGGGSLRFRWQAGSWVEVGGSGYSACPAT